MKTKNQKKLGFKTNSWTHLFDFADYLPDEERRDKRTYDVSWNKLPRFQRLAA
jgi:hypothetical protein